ncbi:MAG: glycosyltransferase [Planctomycetota bacterium]
MRVLYVGMEHDYGDPSRGLSHEHCNLYESLVGMGLDVVHFDYAVLLRELGRDAMNARLVDAARVCDPDVVLTVMFRDELDPAVLKRLSRSGVAPTVNWFSDDHWRFERYTAGYAKSFNYCVTTASSAVEKYRRLGQPGVIKSQWACNHFRYRPVETPLEYDVSFVGQNYGDRGEVIAALRDAGFGVSCFGLGWEAGRVSPEEMIRVFCASKINLNLNNASRAPRLTSGERWARRGRRVGRAFGLVGPEKPVVLPQQIKGRNFEPPGCDAFMVTGDADNLSDYYEPGAEAVVYRSTAELIELVGRYLDDDEGRRAIARRAYERTLREHTYAHRFHDIFTRMGVSMPSVEAVVAGGAGRVEAVEA